MLKPLGSEKKKKKKHKKTHDRKGFFCTKQSHVLRSFRVDVLQENRDNSFLVTLPVGQDTFGSE